MYEFNHRIEHCWGSGWNDAEQFYGLLVYTKQKLPHFNVYAFLKNFDLGFNLLMYSFKVCPLGKLDTILIPDMLEYFEWHHLPDYLTTHLHELNSVVDELHCLGYCYQNGFQDKVREKINTTTIKHILQHYTQTCKTYVTNLALETHLSKHYSFDFNLMINKIFRELHELGRLGLINMTEIGLVGEYLLTA